MKTIRRKTLLRPTKVEYGDFAINHVLGCSHGCKFPCYAFLNAMRFKQVENYQDWCEPKLVSNIGEILDREIEKLSKKIKSVQLCFATDPFMFQQEDVKLASLAIIEKLNKHGIKVCTLTKGITPPELSICFPNKENEYGITLVSLDENFRKRYEPKTAPYGMRIDALKFLAKEHRKTWVSIEPYPTPNIVEQDLRGLLDKVSFAKKIVFGRWNYNSLVMEYPHAKEFYNECVKIVRSFCLEFNIECIIKKGTWTNLPDKT